MHWYQVNYTIIRARSTEVASMIRGVDGKQANALTAAQIEAWRNAVISSKNVGPGDAVIITNVLHLPGDHGKSSEKVSAEITAVQARLQNPND